MKAMIFAAGLGTRLRPLTDFMPKALMPVQGRPAIYWIIDRLILAGVTEVVVNVHHQADLLEAALADYPNHNIRFGISDERDELLETGGGLLHAAELLDGPDSFLVVNADIFSNIKLQDFYQSHVVGDAIATLAVQARETSRYLVTDDTNMLCGWMNTKTGERKMVRELEGPERHLAFSGIQAVNPLMLALIPQRGKFSIIDSYLALANKFNVSLYEHSEDFLIDLGTRENLEMLQSPRFNPALFTLQNE
jgi:NDP-sugar pyrophosphorylase family protein